MAKTTKKLKTSETKTETKKTEEVVLAPAPPVQPGLVTISMLPNELHTLTNLMSICSKIFEEQAMIAMQQNNEERFAILAHRHKTISMFADRFAEFCKMPEPVSRDMH